MALADLQGTDLSVVFRKLDPSGQRFEEFIRRLLEHECDLRNAASVRGPTRYGISDRGKDLILDVSQRPHVAWRPDQYWLTWDDVGQTWYSLKAGDNWRPDIHDDVGWGEFLTDPSMKAKKAPPRELLEHMASGGRYVVVTVEPTHEHGLMRARITAALHHWLEHGSLPEPQDLADKIGFIDGNHLASFVRRHRPTLPRQLENGLGLETPEGLMRWEQWTRDPQRERPPYEPDDARRPILAAIADRQSPPVIRIFGPPGVGKTRLVYQALEEAKLTESVYYTYDAGVAEWVVSSRWLERDAGAIHLVIDEVDSTRARRLARDFLSFAKLDQYAAKLILIGVTDEDARPGRETDGKQESYQLDKLASETTRKLVERAMGVTDGSRGPLVERVLRLADGYPWFAILLAQAIASDEDALTTGDDRAIEWDAAMHVLAGPPADYDRPAIWRRQAELYAKCLLVVIMTGDRDIDWDALWTTHGEALREALDETEDWQEIKRAEVYCREREILRYVGSSNRRYVSPANLTRMILERFFSGGPGPNLGPRVMMHTPEFHGRVLAQATRFATRRVRDRLGSAFLEELGRRSHDGESLDSLLNASEPLYAVVERLPEHAAGVFSAVIRAHDPSTLADAQTLRYALRGPLEILVQAPVSWASFEQLEDALFRLARVDDQNFANNATGIWRSLFLVCLSQTHQPWAARFKILVRRCTSGPCEDRRLALEGLAASVSSTERGLGHAPGRSWPQPSEEEGFAQKREAWTLLLQLCASEEAVLADRARTIVAREMRGWIQVGAVVDPPLVDSLGYHVSAWTVAQRHVLAETIVDIRRYDADLLSETLESALARLEASLEFDEFVERLVAQVGRWHPGPWQIDDPQREELEAGRDEALAREALGTPELLAREWPWMSSSAAHRRGPFMRTLGRIDGARVFLPSLEQFAAKASPFEARVLASYVEGWSLAPDGDAVDAWIAAQTQGSSVSAAIMVLPYLSPSDARLGLLIDQIGRGSTEDLALLQPLSSRWVEQTSLAVMLRLLEVIGERPDLARFDIALSRQLLSRELGEFEAPVVEHALASLNRTTQLQMPIVLDRDWERLALALADRNKVDEVSAAVLDLLVGSEPLLAARVLTKLFERGHADRVWEQVGARLERERDTWALVWELSRVGLPAQLEPKMLDWVGQNETRAMLVAQLVNPHGPKLSEVARALLTRFGAHGSVADALTSRVFSTPRATRSLTEFKQRQLSHAEEWAKDEFAEVRVWSAEVARALDASISEELAQAEFRRKFA